jgi:hypothetical protein
MEHRISMFPPLTIPAMETDGVVCLLVMFGRWIALTQVSKAPGLAVLAPQFHSPEGREAGPGPEWRLLVPRRHRLHCPHAELQAHCPVCIGPFLNPINNKHQNHIPSSLGFTLSALPRSEIFASG